MKEITELYAYLAEDGDEEGICTIHMNGVAFPTVFGKMHLAFMTETFIKNLARDSGKTIRLVKFSERTVMKLITEST